MIHHTFTRDQKKALDLNFGKLVLAGAGSGKTTVLTERYIRLLAEKGVFPNQIVAVTFTRKAAAQLQVKVFEELRNRERGKDDHTAFWRNCRERMPWARIGTIHSFCAGLLRSYPLEAGVDPDFRIGFKAEIDLREQIRLFLRRLSADRDGIMAALLEVLPEERDIENLLYASITRPGLGQALLALSNEPEEAIKFLDYSLHHLIEVIKDVLPAEYVPGSHRGFVMRLQNSAMLYSRYIEKERRPVFVLDYDELEQRTMQLLSTQPEVADQIRDSVSYLLVDEFQDTSSTQWGIIQRIVKNREGELIADKPFFVGDEKQSIYGFRQANITVSRKAETLLENSIRSSGASGRGIECLVKLTDNFRTLPDLINPLNAALRRMLKPLGGHRLGFDSRPQDLTSRRESPTDVEALLEIALCRFSSQGLTFRYIARRLYGEVQSGTRISDPDTPEETARPLKYEDVGMLLRTRTHLSELEDALRAEGIPFTVTGGRGFFEKQEILDLRNLIAALTDPKEKIAWIGVLRGPLFNISDPAIVTLVLAGDNPCETWKRFAEGRMEDDSVFGALLPEDSDALRDGHALWQKLKRDSAYRPATELLLMALEESGAWAAYASGQRGDQRIANIFKFVDILRDLEDNGLTSLREVHRSLEELATSPEAEMDAEADIQEGKGVRITTIHAAKGLEFPYVILPDLRSVPRPKGRFNRNRGTMLVPSGSFSPLADPALVRLALTNEKDEGFLLHSLIADVLAPAEEHAESRRLQYVAATRARDRLLLVSHVLDTKGKISLRRNSALALWLDAFGITVDDDGFTESDIPGVLKTEIFEEDLPGNLTPWLAPEVDEIDFDIEPQPGADPSVRLASPPMPDRWVLPVTALASYLADPGDDRLRSMVLNVNMEKSLEALEAHSGSKMAENGLETLENTGKQSADVVGEILHRIYQDLGPGCSWREAEEPASRLMDGYRFNDDDLDAVIKRIRMLIEGGTELNLGRYSSGSVRELPILFNLDAAVLRGRIDLAWRDGNRAVLVDYKTNQVEESRVDALITRRGYDHQAKLYALGLARAWGLDKALARLVFLSPRIERDFKVDVNEIIACYAAEVAALTLRWREMQAGARTAG